MKTQTLWQVEANIVPGQEKHAQQVFEDLLQTPVCTYVDEQTKCITLSAYLTSKPSPSLLKKLENCLRDKLIERQNNNRKRDTIFMRRLAPRDWVQSWQRHIRPISVGSVLLIRPTWDKTPPKPGQHLIELDPGLSFGTGHHPTTLYCLKELVRRSRRAPATFLDVGTGSGLLAIAAARLGFRRITAFDNDPEAVRVARSNARSNGVGRRIRFFQGDVATYIPPHECTFDVVAANLTDELLIKHAQHIAGCVAPDGWLVLAGILTERFPLVRSSYEDLNMRLIRRWDKGEWTGATFQSSPIKCCSPACK